MIYTDKRVTISYKIRQQSEIFPFNKYVHFDTWPVSKEFL